MNEIDTCTALLDTVVKDLQARGDYRSVQFTVPGQSKPVSAADAVSRYSDLKEALLIQKAGGASVPGDQLTSAKALTAALIDANVGILTMGQLALNRSITPAVATANNLSLAKLKDALIDLTASASGGSKPGQKDEETPPLPHGPYEADDVPDVDEQYP